MNELSKEYSKAIQGIAILFMLMLHLFCRRDNLPYDVLFYINDVPILYYVGLWGDQCVALFCFCAGYASYLQQEKCDKKTYVNYSIKRIVKLLINYWIVVILSALIGVLIGKGNIIPGTFFEFICNFFLISNSYNGAWWFLFTYVLLTVLSLLLYRIVRSRNNIIVLCGIGIIYIISYLVRFDFVNFSDMRGVYKWVIRQGALLGTSVLPYEMGMLFYKNKIISKLRRKSRNLSGEAVIALSTIAFGICIVTHSIEESLIIAPIYAVITVCVISLWNGKVIKFLNHVGEHSTNIWLTHMFFYLVLFDGFIFIFKYPILIYIVMFALCLISSYLINTLLVKIVSKIKFLN